MKKRLILAFTVAVMALGFTACHEVDPADETVPFGRPASWEGQGPNMPNIPGQPSY